MHYVNERKAISSVAKDNEILESIQFKSAAWEFEQEIRLFFKNFDKRYINIKKNNIQSIYLGAKIDPKNKELILDYTSHLEINIYQMQLDEEEFKLKF